MNGIPEIHGYKIHMKEREASRNGPDSCRGKCKNGRAIRSHTMYAAHSCGTPRANPVRASFRDVRKTHFRAARPCQKRTDEGNVTRSDEKGCHMQGFERKKTEGLHLGDAESNVDLGTPLSQISQPHLGTPRSLSPGGRTLVGHDHLGAPHALSSEGRTLASHDEDELELRELD